MSNLLAADRLRGVLVIAQTPFQGDLQLDEEVFRLEVEFLVACGVNGIVWPAAASEIMSLSLSERLLGVRWIADQCQRRVPIIVGVTAPNQFEAAELAAHAREAGAAAVLTLAPTDYQPTDPAMFGQYLAAIGEKGQRPIIVQTSYPGHSSSLTPGLLCHLAKENPLLQYVKEEQLGFGPLPWRISAYAKAESGLGAFGGAGARNLLNEYARGSVGTMPGAGFADIQVSLWRLCEQNRLDEARILFGKMLMMAVLEQSTGYVLQKEILRRRGIFKNTLMRYTRNTLLDAGDLRELDAIIKTLEPDFKIPIASTSGEVSTTTTTDISIVHGSGA